MPHNAQLIAGWIIFAFLVGCCGYLALAACDLGIRPLFALGYCSVHASPDRLADQHARERDLRGRIHEAELRLARLPVCAAPSPSPLPPEPKKEAEVVTPTPRPTPTPQPSPTETPQPQDQLKIPKNLSELKGCWQSASGDLPLITDDEERRPVGDVRICYCFGDKGRGSVRYRYTDGRKCSGPARARLSDGKLVIDEPEHCTVRSEITCSSQEEGNSATCDAVDYGRMPGRGFTGEKFQRVTAEHCR
jgi:hypothetical protein